MLSCLQELRRKFGDREDSRNEHFGRAKHFIALVRRLSKAHGAFLRKSENREEKQQGERFCPREATPHPSLAGAESAIMRSRMIVSFDGVRGPLSGEWKESGTIPLPAAS